MFEKTWNPALFWSSWARASVRLRAKQRPFPITTLFGPAILFKESKTACENKTTFVDYLGAAQLFEVSNCPKLQRKHKRSRCLHLLCLIPDIFHFTVFRFLSWWNNSFTKVCPFYQKYCRMLIMIWYLLTFAYSSPFSMVLIMALISWTVCGTVLPTCFTLNYNLWVAWKFWHFQGGWGGLGYIFKGGNKEPTSFCFSRSARRFQDPW